MEDPFGGNRGVFGFMSKLWPRIEKLAATVHPLVLADQSSTEEESSDGE